MSEMEAEREKREKEVKETRAELRKTAAQLERASQEMEQKDEKSRKLRQALESEIETLKQQHSQEVYTYNSNLINIQNTQNQ